MKGTGWMRAVTPTVLSVVLLIGLTAFPAAAGHDHRLTIEIEEPYVFDGNSYPAGVLSMRTVRQYNPSSTLHEIWIDGECLGVFMARHTSRDGRDTKHAALFERNAEGQLVLAGFRLGNGRSIEQYRFNPRPIELR